MTKIRWSGMRGAIAALLVCIPLLNAQAANPRDWWVDVVNDRAARVDQMLREGADPNEISAMGQPAIMQAIREGAWEVYDVLVNHPATVFNAINTHRETPLMYLAVIGDTERARDLIRRGALVNRQGWTPLHYAASTGQIETARMLLEHGAVVDALAPDGTTPLMMAAYGGSEPMVRVLLEAGADISLRTTQHYNVVDWAGFKSHTVLARKLQALIDGPASVDSVADEAGPGSAPAGQAALPAASAEQKSSTSRYFDLDRFNEPVSP